MNSWDDFLRNPPPEIAFPTSWDTDPEAYHCVRWVGYGGEYEGKFEVDELWNFGSAPRWKGMKPAERSFTKYGGETLCGLKIDSGLKMYGPRWRSIESTVFPSEPPDEYNLRAVLTDLYGITCMVCRKQLMYGVSRIIEDLTFIRRTLVSDWLGEEYVSREPLVHGKHVVSSEKEGNLRSEMYRYRCKTAREAINPQLVDDVKETEGITCPDCLENLAAGVLP